MNTKQRNLQQRLINLKKRQIELSEALKMHWPHRTLLETERRQRLAESHFHVTQAIFDTADQIKYLNKTHITREGKFYVVVHHGQTYEISLDLNEAFVKIISTKFFRCCYLKQINITGNTAQKIVKLIKQKLTDYLEAETLC